MKWIVDCLDCDLYAVTPSLKHADEIAYLHPEYHSVRVSRGEE